MTDDNRSFDENEWTSDELAELEALSAARVPPGQLKRHTIEALRNRGLVRSTRSITPRILVALAAAASLVFAAGAFVGYATAVRHAAPPVVAPVAATTAVAARPDSVAAVPSRATKQVVWF